MGRGNLALRAPKGRPDRTVSKHPAHSDGFCWSRSNDNRISGVLRAGSRGRRDPVAPRINSVLEAPGYGMWRMARDTIASKEVECWSNAKWDRR